MERIMITRLVFGVIFLALIIGGCIPQMAHNKAIKALEATSSYDYFEYMGSVCEVFFVNEMVKTFREIRQPFDFLPQNTTGSGTMYDVCYDTTTILFNDPEDARWVSPERHRERFKKESPAGAHQYESDAVENICLLEDNEHDSPPPDNPIIMYTGQEWVNVTFANGDFVDCWRPLKNCIQTYEDYICPFHEWANCANKRSCTKVFNPEWELETLKYNMRLTSELDWFLIGTGIVGMIVTIASFFLCLGNDDEDDNDSDSESDCDSDSDSDCDSEEEINFYSG
jgi:hypothetical protein